MINAFLDRKTGEILVVMDELVADDFEEEDRELQERIESDPERYVYIDPIDSRDGFRIMEAFVGTLPESEERRTLVRALSWKKPFSNFKDALFEMPEIRQQWFEFQDRRMREYAKSWLVGMGIDAELVEPGDAARR